MLWGIIMTKYLVTLVAVICFSACATPSQPLPAGGVSPTIQVQTGSEFDIVVNQQAVVEGTPVRIRFNGVSNESRCPSDVQCVWAGNAVARLGLTSTGNPDSNAALNTTLDPKFAYYAGYRISLVGLKPYPRSGSPISAGDYVATLRVERR
jgi:hypothetical protein